MPNFIKHYVLPISDVLSNRFKEKGNLTNLELDLLTACTKINQVIGDFDAVKQKYINYFDRLKATLTSNKQKMQTSIDKFNQAKYLSNIRLIFMAKTN
jgi:thiamine pyrophosphokinase